VLEEMRIRALGVIDDAVLPLARGFNVITGETGAGKTMVVTGLGLLFGGRADSGTVRADAGSAVIEGRLQVDPDGAAAARATEAGGELEEDDVLLLARTISSVGRSRAHVGGRSVPVGVLGDLAEHCVAVHGQADQFRLLHPARQRAALDRFAGLAQRRDTFAAQYDELRALEREVAELAAGMRERRQEADLLRFGLEEVAAVSPTPDEDVLLAQEEERLAHADALRLAATAAHALLAGATDVGGGDEAADASTLVGAALAGIDQAGVHDAALEVVGSRLREAGYALSEIASDLASYAAGVDVDPARLAAVQDRRAALSRLTRKYGDDDGSVMQVLAWSERAIKRLTELEGDDDRIAGLTDRAASLRAKLAVLAGELTRRREAAAAELEAAVTSELTALAMPQAQLAVTVSQAESADGLLASGDGERLLAFGAHGVDDIEILLRPHPGAPPRPLHKGASGGELSRVMLALEVVLAGADPVPTMVFDEVDAAVGGKAAVEVGRRLARLAQTTQVIAVTHLPQVAAFADRHLVVRKASSGVVTSSDVTLLDDDGRVAELSRMFAGLEHSDSARAHAIELLAAAGHLVEAAARR
jgi:DNA repair protein RecN (Recombination protein N)